MQLFLPIRSRRAVHLLSLVTTAVIVLSIPFITRAQETTPTIAPKITGSDSESDSNNIDLLKEKIATKVAELASENQKTFTGVITTIDVDTNMYTIKTDEKRSLKLSIEESATDIFSTNARKKEEAIIDDLKEGVYISAAGIFIDDILNTNVVYIQNEPALLSGKVTEIDAKNFSVNLVTGDKTEYSLDIETETVQKSITTDNFTLQESGFSDIEVGDTVHFVINVTPQNRGEKNFSAARLVRIPQSLFATPTPQ